MIKTLVVGIDIAKRTHYACFVDDQGRVLHKSFSLSQAGDVFEFFYQRILGAMKENEKTEVIVGIGPTGHYWLNLAYFLEERGIPLDMVNPMHVKRSKELDDNLPTKHDRKDALVIARLIKYGRFSYLRILKGMEAELRVGSSFRSKLTEELGAVKNMMIRWLDRYFTEFTQVFPSFGKMAMGVLECTPFPSDLHQKQTDEVLTLYCQVEGLKSPQRPKAMRLIEVAAYSIRVTEGREMARFEIATLVRRYHQLEQEIEDINQRLVELVQTSVEYERTAKIRKFYYTFISSALTR